MSRAQVPPPVRRHFVSLDSLRGVAACLVVLHHMPGDGLLIGSGLARNGLLAVDFFFVLSGFIIAANYADRLAGGFSQVRFWIYRLGRLWPLHLAVLLASVLVEAVGLFIDSSRFIARLPFTEGRSLDNLLTSALLLQAWQGEGGNGWNVQSWSISVEVFLYLLFGLAWGLAGRFVAATLAFVLVVWTAWFNLSGWLGNDLVGRGLFGFSLGVLSWELRSRFSALCGLLRGTGAEILTVIACVVAVAAYPDVELVPAGLVFAMAVMVFSADAGTVSRILARPFPVLLGSLSYSIYMVHALIVGRVFDVLTLGGAWWGRVLVDRSGVERNLVAGPYASDLIALATLGAVVGASVMTYRWIERPTRAWSRGLGARFGSAAPVVIT